MRPAEFVDKSRGRVLTFKDFLAWKQEARAHFPKARDFSETRLARSFYNDVEPVFEVDRSKTHHRCDLARLWLEVRGLPAEIGSRRARVCVGVRAALTGLFAAFAQQRASVAIPADVYPVYEEIALRVRLGSYYRVSTFPSLDLAELLTQLTCEQVRPAVTHLLLPFPLKLHGRAWTAEEVDTAVAWLREDAARRLILDGVYSFGQPLGADLRRLLDTDQVIYLDSLSKGWLREWVMGVAILPEQDLQRLAPALDPSLLTRCWMTDLPLAHYLLTKERDLPQVLAAELDRLREQRCATLPAWETSSRVDRGYLLPVARSPLDLLVEENLIALPASAFGSSRTDWSIVSALRPVG